MKKMFFAAAVAIVMTLEMPGPVSAKLPTTKIRITGGQLSSALEVTDPQVLRRFSAWHGYMDLSRRVVTAPTEGRQRYEVWFYVKFSYDDVRMAYVLYYHPGPSGEPGHIYLPRRGEKWYQLNASTVQMATGWFYASREWDALLKPLITAAEAAKRTVPVTRQVGQARRGTSTEGTPDPYSRLLLTSLGRR